MRIAGNDVMKRLSAYIYASEDGSIHRHDGKPISVIQASNGYMNIRLSIHGDRINTSVHRFVFYAFNGSVSEGKVIDHINEDKTDNRPSNLREVTQSQNLTGRKRSKRSGQYPYGIHRVSRDVCVSKRFVADINIGGKMKRIGYYETVEDAKDALDKYASTQTWRLRTR